MHPPKLDIVEQPTGTGAVVAQLTGKLSLETVAGFLQNLRQNTAEKLILDLGGVTYLDSAGVGGLVQLFVHRKGKSCKMALANLTQQGQAVMQVSGLTKLMPTFATVDEATTGL